MSSRRQLAAIMFSDIVGYSAMMHDNEREGQIKVHRYRQVLKQLAGKHGGEIIQHYGDGSLSIFSSALEAVSCAREIQLALKETPQVPLRIGLHAGDIVIDGDDIFGDGVNIASRVESMGVPGCVLMTRRIVNDVRNHPEHEVTSLGFFEFKNIPEPMEVFALSNEGFPLPQQEEIKGKVKAIDHSGKAGRWPRKLKVRAAGTVIALLWVVLLILLNTSTSLPFLERDWIVMSDFENLTEDPVFDHSLNVAFSLSINQSQFVNIFTRQRMQETLKRMKRAGMEFVDEETGREIAMREGIRLCVIPSISQVGSRYVLTSKILEAESGDILKSEVLYADSQNEILKTLDKLGRRVRRSLGEPGNKIREHSKPLLNVTTSSLEALEQFSMGRKHQINLQFDQARVHFENAIQIDSNFTAAKASLGNLLFEIFDREKGREWLEQAILNIDNLTDRERYSILAFYAVNVEKDLDKGIGYTKTLVESYPDDPLPHNNLGWYYLNQGFYEKAVEEGRAAVQIDPYLAIAYPKIIWPFLAHLGEMDSAVTWSMRMVEYAPENAWGYYYLGSAFVGKKEYEEAEAAFLKGMEKDAGALWGVYRIAHLYRIQGRYDKAIGILEDIRRLFPEESSVHYDLGVNYGLNGRPEKARDHFLEYQKVAEKWLVDSPDDPKSYFYNGILLTRLGEKAAGWEMGRKGLDIDSTSSYLECAQFFAVQGRTTEALDCLEKALGSGYRDLVWISLLSDLDTLRDEDRYRDLIRQYFGPAEADQDPI